MSASAGWWPREYLFLLTHPDSLTPALAALLAEQLDICGSAGSQLAYAKRLDLFRLRWQLARAHRSWPHGRYLFDAIVDNDAYVPLQLTGSQRLRALVCVRRPLAALVDMLAIGAAANLSEAAERYCARVEWLASASHNLGERALVFPTEMILTDTNTLLAAIALHLDLQVQFKTVPEPLLEAEREPLTQERWLPDCDMGLAAELDPALSVRCDETYRYALQELSQHCLSVGLGRLHTHAELQLWSTEEVQPLAAVLGVARTRAIAPARHTAESLR
jgi:hypothetical protein